jgi:hypothetical protein
LTATELQIRILSENHPHFLKNEEGNGSRWVHYRPQELLCAEEFFSMLNFENGGNSGIYQITAKIYLLEFNVYML